MIKNLKVSSVVLYLVLYLGILQLSSGFAQAAINYVQSAASNNVNSGSSLIQAFPSSNVAGNLIVVAVAFDTTGGTTWSCSDSRGNAYQVATNVNDSRHSQLLGICYAPNVKAGSNTVTVSYGGVAHTWRSIAVHEYSGVDPVSPLDTTRSNASTGTTITSGSVTPVQNGELLFGTTIDDSGTTVINAGSGFVRRQFVGSAFASEDRIQSVAGSIAATFAFSTSQDYIAQIATFKPAATPSDTTPPTVTVTAPVNNATVGGSVTVTATANDNVGVVGVQFLLDGAGLNAEDTTSPYSITWNTTSATNGNHGVTARARDAAGNTSTSSVVNVVVNNQSSDVTPPTTPTGLLASQITSDSAVLTWNASTDNVGVAGYRIYRAGVPIATSTQNSFADSGLSPSTNYTYTVAAFDAAGNNSVQSASIVVTTSAASQSPFAGPLRVNPNNRRYFTDDSGKAIYLAGGHTWENFTDNGYLDPPTPFDYVDYLNMMQSRGDNLIRLWTWEQSKWMTFTTAPYYFGQSPFQRTGPGLASDGKPKFDLTKFDQSYFDRLRQHVIDAGNKGIYAAIMLFNGWSLEKKGQVQNPWPGHVMNAANNINGINGDLDGDGTGNDAHTLGSSAITAIQDAYLRKLIDSVNDLDNVLYEVTNEDQGSSQNITWQYHVINYVKNYEATKAKQHPAGMTGYCGGCDDAPLYASPADWIAPSNLSYQSNPPAADGRKVIISDTDHLWGANGGDRVWVWKSFTRGVNTLFMDTYGSTDYADAAHPGSNPNSPVWISLRQNMGYAINYSRKMNLNLATPQSSLFSTGYGLANAAASNAEYLGYLPSGGSITVNLSATPGNLTVEWFNTETGVAVGGAAVAGGASRTLTAPFSGDAVVYLTNIGTGTTDSNPPTTPTNLQAANVTSTSVSLSWNASSDNVGVAGYNIYRNGSFLAATTQTSYLSSGLNPSTTYSYAVSAYDASNNVSPLSPVINVTTSAGQPASIAFVQLAEVAPNTSGNNVSTPTFNSAVTNGNLMVVWVWYNSNTQSVSNVTDTKGNVYARAVGPTTGTGTMAGWRQELWYAKNVVGGTGLSVTATFSGTFSARKAITAHEYSGLDPIAPLDATAAAVTSNANASSPAVNTSFSRELIFAAALYQVAGTSGSGFTLRSSIQSNVSEDRIVSASGSYAATFSNSAQIAIIQVATFKAAGQ